MASTNMFDILNVDEDTHSNKKEVHGKGAKAAAAKTGGRAPKHEFERHSGTGRGKEQRKSGAGKFWGGKAENEEESARIGQRGGDFATEATYVDEDDDTPVLGLDDFMKAKADAAVQEDAKVKSRASKPNEKFSKGHVLAKKVDQPLFADCVERKSKGKNSTKNRKNVVSLDEFVAVNPGSAPARSNNNAERRGPRDGERKGNSSRGGARGGNRGSGETRGRGRGRGGGARDGQRGGGRGGARGGARSARPNSANNKDVPSLGGN